ncbi:MAG: response regulator [Desulfobacterales bacterium]|nr:response regulator [Desulfobacterales bacterium]
MNCLDVGLIIVDIDYTILFFNEWVRIHLPYSLKKTTRLIELYKNYPIQQKIITDCIHEAITKQMTRKLSQAFHTWSVPLPDLRFKDGLMRQTCTVSPIVYEKGDRVCAMIQILDESDAWLRIYSLRQIKSELSVQNEQMKKINAELEKEISLRKETEQILVQAKNEAEKANSTKDVFLAKVSHEMRTPMNAIIGLTDRLIRQNYFLPRDKHHTKIIKLSAENLMRIINDLIDISKIEADKIEIISGDFSLLSMLETVIQSFSAHVHEKGLKLYYSFISPVQDYLIGDSARLSQILINLINNAIKFTPEGEIHLTIAVEQETHKYVLLRFNVTDTGIGIPPEKIEEIFKPFVQVENSLDRSHEGLGLGLSIIQKLVHLMGGTLGVESQVGKGSNFWFTVRLGKTRQNVREKQSTSITSDADQDKSDKCVLKILLAEDNPFNQEVVLSFLNNHQIQIANNGKEAIEILQKEHMDIVLMDIEMPHMDGVEATRIIRDKNSSVLNHDIPIIALTAHSFKKNIDNYLLAGMNSVITKPINIKTLLDEIEKFSKYE